MPAEVFDKFVASDWPFEFSSLAHRAETLREPLEGAIGRFEETHLQRKGRDDHMMLHQMGIIAMPEQSDTRLHFTDLGREVIEMCKNQLRPAKRPPAAGNKVYPRSKQETENEVRRLITAGRQ